MQHDTVRSAAEDRDCAYFIVAGGAPDLIKKSRRFCHGEQVFGSAISPVGAFLLGLAHLAERVTAKSYHYPL